MKILSIISLFFVVGCSGTPTDGSKTIVFDGGDAAQQTPEPFGPNALVPGGSDVPSCGNASETVIINLLDGGSAIAQIPIPCNPVLLDKGDPAPDHVLKNGANNVH